MVRVVWWLKSWAAEGEYRANTAEAQSHKELGQMFKLRSLVEGLNWTIRGEPERVAKLINAGLIHRRSAIVAALLKDDGTVREAICRVCEGFLAKGSFDAKGPFAGASSDQAYVLFVVRPFIAD